MSTAQLAGGGWLRSACWGGGVTRCLQRGGHWPGAGLRLCQLAGRSQTPAGRAYVAGHSHPLLPAQDIAALERANEFFEVGNGMLAVGDERMEVEQLQRFLKAQGYLKPESCTGFFGRATERALRDWQRDVGVENVDGVFGGDCYAAFLAEQAKRATELRAAEVGRQNDPAKATVTTSVANSGFSFGSTLQTGLKGYVNSSWAFLVAVFLSLALTGAGIGGAIGNVLQKRNEDTLDAMLQKKQERQRRLQETIERDRLGGGPLEDVDL